MIALLPCPFCGSNKQTVLGPTCAKADAYDPNDRAFPMVRCGGCFTDVPGKDWDGSGATAVEAWNRRAPINQQYSEFNRLMGEDKGSV